jgi:uncharacterized membrane protein YhaH (DUF805 family)
MMAHGFALPRLRRRFFWLLSALVWTAHYAVREGLAIAQAPDIATASAIITMLALGMLCVARLHDRNRSGWWLAVALVPVAGALWLAWELALRRGTPDANAYGADPHGRAALVAGGA